MLDFIENKSIKARRHRSTKNQVTARRDALLNIVSEIKPATVRQVFYQASVHGIVEKTEAGYAKVQTDLTLLRRSGALPYDCLADNTRWHRKPETFSSARHAVLAAAQWYRKSLWDNVGARVEIWLEKDALSGVIYPVTEEFDVPLMVTRGYASLSFLHSAAESIAKSDVPTHIYHLGDYDPSGVNAAHKVEQTLRELAPHADIHFERIGVTEQQIREWKLPSRPTKSSDTRARSFGSNVSVELDAIEPEVLRALVRVYVERHITRNHIAAMRTVEEAERKAMLDFATKFLNGEPRP